MRRANDERLPLGPQRPKVRGHRPELRLPAKLSPKCNGLTISTFGTIRYLQRWAYTASKQIKGSTGGSDAYTWLGSSCARNHRHSARSKSSDLRSSLPGLPAGLGQQGQLYRVWLHIHAPMCCVSFRPCGRMLCEPILLRASIRRSPSVPASPVLLGRFVRNAKPHW